VACFGYEMVGEEEEEEKSGLVRSCWRRICCESRTAGEASLVVVEH
jgi:hypothetical protein